MTSYTNDDLYQICLNRLRKDRKGVISPEEFESFLRLRNIDYFQKMLQAEGSDKMIDQALSKFLILQDDIAITTSNGEHYVILDADYVGPSAEYKIAEIVNVWYSTSNTDFSSKIPVDLVTHAEWHDRKNNAITGPTNEYPIAYKGLYDLPIFGLTEVLWAEGGASFESNYVVLDYYKYPADPYFDYYTDANGNVTYLTDGQSAYTLQTNEVARDGKVAGQQVTSASEDLEWDDIDALNILDMIMTDLGVSQSDQGVVEASLIERQNNSK